MRMLGSVVRIWLEQWMDSVSLGRYFAGDVGLNERSSSKRCHKHKLVRYIVELLVQRDFTPFFFIIAS